MYTDENYLWGLLAYYVGAVLVMLCLYNYRKLVPWRHLRNVLLLLVAVVLLVPVKAYPDLKYLAPAWFVGFYALITKEQEEAIRAFIPIVVVIVLMAVGYPLGYLLLKRRSTVKKKTANH